MIGYIINLHPTRPNFIFHPPSTLDYTPKTNNMECCINSLQVNNTVVMLPQTFNKTRLERMKEKVNSNTIEKQAEFKQKITPIDQIQTLSNTINRYGANQPLKLSPLKYLR